MNISLQPKRYDIVWHIGNSLEIMKSSFNFLVPFCVRKRENSLCSHDRLQRRFFCVNESIQILAPLHPNPTHPLSIVNCRVGEIVDRQALTVFTRGHSHTKIEESGLSVDAQTPIRLHKQQHNHLV